TITCKANDGSGKYATCRIIVNPDVLVDVKTIDNNSVTIIERYTISGQRITTPQKGVNILRMSDGSVKKVLVK
ncbi:MAG: hypothetical protein IJT97_11180, partial [Bacteroidaceae bacterium]|nr:hypothetical protein [Bacteroidaceae bacterium]